MIPGLHPAKRVPEAGRYRKEHSAESACRRVIAHATVVKPVSGPQRFDFCCLRQARSGHLCLSRRASTRPPSIVGSDDEEFAQSVRARRR